MANVNAIGQATGANYRQQEAKSGAATGFGFKEEFSAILEQKKETVRETLEEMNERKKLLETVKAEREPDETLVRFMPDGTIMTLEVEDGKVVSTSKHKPQMKVVLDDSKPLPTNADGTANVGAAATKLEPYRDLFMMMPAG